MTPTIVSGAISTLTDLDRDEAWLQGWLREQPGRLGLGALSVDAAPADASSVGSGGFTATLDDRCFSVDVQLGELDASHGFGVLDAWARNKARLPEKDHVAVLVTESCGERYRPTLETLSSHLPLVVIELAVWRGESEAIVVPHVALASAGVDLGSAPASAAATAMSQIKEATAKPAVSASTPTKEVAKAAPAAASKLDSGSSPAVSDGGAPGDKDDTGVADPWGLPSKETEAAAATASTPNGSRLLTKFST